MKTWILVAAASEASIFAVHWSQFLQGEASLVWIKSLKHPESGQHDSDRLSDKMGRYHGRQEGYGTFVETTDPKVHEADKFALTVVRELDLARTHGDYQDLVLVAPPAFYGHLNRHIHPALQSYIKNVIEKDYTKDTADVLAAHLRQQIG